MNDETVTISERCARAILSKAGGGWPYTELEEALPWVELDPTHARLKLSGFGRTVGVRVVAAERIEKGSVMVIKLDGNPVAEAEVARVDGAEAELQILDLASSERVAQWAVLFPDRLSMEPK